MKDKLPLPPRWAERFLCWYCKPELLEDLQGDLNEYFERNLRSEGIRKAKLIYIIDVIKFLRIYTVRKPKFIDLLIHWIMIGSYIKTSSRSIVRNKLFSAINIIGLSVSMSVGLLVITIVSDLTSYDDFHANKERIYRVNSTIEFSGEDHPIDLASNSVKAGKRIKETFAGIDEITLLRNNFNGDAQIGENTLPVGGLWADESFFNVFTFPLTQGNKATALKEPYSIVLTEKTAQKLFGTTNAIGKTIRFDTTNYEVTGVMKDIPKLSHMRFDLIVSFSTAEIVVAKSDPNFMAWDNVWQNFIYVLLPEHADTQAWKANLDKLSEDENKNIQNKNVQLSLQPLKSIALGRHLQNAIGPVMIPLVVWILAGMAFVIIISACFNYTNLSIARSLRRSREVGIRKIIGALKGHVLNQFISESVMISLLALLFSFSLFLFLRSQFISLDSHIDDLFLLHLSPTIIVYFIAFAVIVGVVAGFLPALFFSRINAIQVLKDATTMKVFRHVNVRKGLIVLQYTLSLIFITTAIIGYNQYKSFIGFDLGYNTETILNIRAQGNKGDLLLKELTELPEVTDISRSLMITSLGSMHGTNMKYKNQDDSTRVWMNLVDEHYLPIHKHKFLAGGNFKLHPANGEETEIIVNEQVLKRFDIAKGDPAEALGEVLTVDKKKLTIVGVLKDFHYGTTEKKIEPFMFRYTNDQPWGYLNAKISSHELPATMKAVEAAWKKIDKIHPLDATFYDDQIEKAYSQFSVMVKVIGFIAFLAVCIASMGMFGMIVFTTETKLKEISIRKVLGASEGSLLYLLSKGFLALLTIAALVALPVTYLFFEKVVLTNFAYHESIQWTELLSGAFFIGLLALLMIGSQTLKAARSNPAKVLKSE